MGNNLLPSLPGTTFTRIQEIYYPRNCDFCKTVHCDWDNGHIMVLMEEYELEYYCDEFCFLGIDKSKLERITR
jgi:hypothetical protein